MLPSIDRLRFLLGRLREKLWVKPLAVCLLSIVAVFLAKLADGTSMADWLPGVAADSVEKLLSIMAASMMVIATFSVGSMVSAYASAASTATPRSFSLIVGDDATQNALSTFVGAFIFSVVALTTLKNEYFESAGLFLLFALTVFVFALVIVTFVRWVDRIARLGRMGSTIEKVESATSDALRRRRKAPRMGGAVLQEGEPGLAVYADKIGYVQHIDMSALQTFAEEADLRIAVAAVPGTLAAPDRPLAYLRSAADGRSDIDPLPVLEAFQIGSDRVFDDDPRFGLVVLSEIAGRALSPAVNDPGTAISIIGTLLRLFAQWNETADVDQSARFDRIEAPEILTGDMFDDAFVAIARDGAGVVEVAVRLQKALRTLAAIGGPSMREAAEHHARMALKRAESALDMDEDLQAVRRAAGN